MNCTKPVTSLAIWDPAVRFSAKEIIVVWRKTTFYLRRIDEVIISYNKSLNSSIVISMSLQIDFMVFLFIDILP